MNRRIWVALLAIVALFTITAVAQAQEDDQDTVFNFGYDEENQVFVWGISSTEGELDCTLEGEYDASYVVLDGDVMIDQLYGTGTTDPATFPVSDDATADPVPYDEAEECELAGTVVSGPEGQVNHGMFLRAFNMLYQGDARGCIVRHIAQSDLGKGDQQVNIEDVDPDAESLETGDTGTIDFSSVLTNCENGRGDDEEGNGRPEWAGQGKPDWAGNGKPPWAGQPGGPHGGSDD